MVMQYPLYNAFNALRHKCLCPKIPSQAKGKGLAALSRKRELMPARFSPLLWKGTLQTASLEEAL